MLHKQHLGVILLASGVAAGQTFEAASVKPSEAATPRYTMKGGPGSSDPGRIAYTNVMLRAVLLTAYDVKNYQLTVPDWMNTLRYDIAANVPESTTKEQFQAMLRNLLAARFKMEVHRETRELPIYGLLPAKGGLKIRASAPGEAPADFEPATAHGEGKDGFPIVNLRSPGVVIETKNGQARATAKDVTMERLADFLTTQAGRPVFDMTTAAGTYSFALYFTPSGPNAADGTEPSLFGALQEQLGLRLEARKGPVEMLVVDRAEKVPAEN